MFRGYPAAPPPRAPNFANFRMQFRGGLFGRPREPPAFRPPADRPPPPVLNTGDSSALLFVGNIDERCPDSLIKEMLENCGPVESWQRMQGPDGRFPPFGFCDFADPASAVLAIRALNSFRLGTKRLNVTADEKAKQILVDYCVKNRLAKRLPRKPLGLELEPDEGDQKQIEDLRKRLRDLIAIRDSALNSQDDHGQTNDLKSPKSTTSHDRSNSRIDDGRHARKRAGASRRSSRSSRSSSLHSRRRRSGSSESSSSSKSYEEDRYSKSEDREQASESDSSDAVYERKERKREQQRKDEEYLRQLKKFEEREKRMAKQYAREDEADETRKKTLHREAKKLMQFLEDYNDEQDDPKYYRSSAFIQRKRDYELEREADNRDRQEETREIAEAKAEVTRGMNGKDHKFEPKHEESLSPSPHVLLGRKVVIKEEESSKPFRYSFVEEHETTITTSVEVKSEDWTPSSDQPSTSSTTEKSKAGQSKVVTTFQSKVLSQVSGVFGEEEAEDEVHVIKKKMKPFEITAQDRIESLTADERKQMIKELIDAIPSNKTELFKYEIGWDLLDNPLLVQRIKPWVEKKIREYIGDDEPSLVTFICERVESRSDPTRLLGDLAMILDDEAESFMIKLWRLIVFQTEAKKIGLNVNKP